MIDLSSWLRLLIGMYGARILGVGSIGEKAGRTCGAQQSHLGIHDHPPKLETAFACLPHRHAKQFSHNQCNFEKNLAEGVAAAFRRPESGDVVNKTMIYMYYDPFDGIGAWLYVTGSLCKNYEIIQFCGVFPLNFEIDCPSHGGIEISEQRRLHRAHH